MPTGSKTKDLIAAVLCGGQSKRMGTDKGLLIKGEKTWAAIAAGKLTDAGLSTVISINETQLEKYRQIFPQTPLIIDEQSINGPLNGLLTLHQNFPDKDILLMACDLIDMANNTIQNLIRHYADQQQFDFYVYEQEGFTQPFCAIYTSRGLRQVYADMEQDKLKKYSLHHQFEGKNTLYIPVSDKESFINHNQLRNI